MKATKRLMHSSARSCLYVGVLCAGCGSGSGEGTMEVSRSCCSLNCLAACPSLRAHWRCRFCALREGSDVGSSERDLMAILRSTIAKEISCLSRVCVWRTRWLKVGVGGMLYRAAAAASRRRWRSGDGKKMFVNLLRGGLKMFVNLLLVDELRTTAVTPMSWAGALLLPPI